MAETIKAKRHLDQQLEEQIIELLGEKVLEITGIPISSDIPIAFMGSLSEVLPPESGRGFPQTLYPYADLHLEQSTSRRYTAGQSR